jgi:PAS domain S-box-containing protein
MTARINADTDAPNAGAHVRAASAELEDLAGQLRQARRTERLLRAAVQASPVNLTISDARKPDLPLTFVNEAFCRTTGYAYDEVIGTNCRFLQGPDTDPDAVRRLREAIPAGRAISVELLNYRKSGEPFWNYLNVAPVFDADGTITAYVGVQHDTTAERRAADAERQRQKLEALGRLAGGVAHEINNLLQPALAFPELIADALPQGATEERQWLAMIESHGLQARGIVRDILSFARADTATLRPLAITPAVSAALDFVGGVLAPSIQLVRAGALADGRPLGQVLCEPGELRQVLANLVANAAYAMEMRGTVIVALDRAAGDAAVHLEITDTGPGMPPDVRARVFEPFFTTKGVGEGTGLGLSIVYGIVQRWGGRIELDSAPGAGTRVRIALPRLPDSPAPAAAGPTTETP